LTQVVISPTMKIGKTASKGPAAKEGKMAKEQRPSPYRAPEWSTHELSCPMHPRWLVYPTSVCLCSRRNVAS